MSEHWWNLHRTTKDCRKDKCQDFGGQNIILKSFISNLDRSRCCWIYLGCRWGLMSCDGCSVYLQSPGNNSWRKPVWQRNRKLFLQTSGDRAGLRPVCGEENTRITLHLSYNQVAVRERQRDTFWNKTGDFLWETKETGGCVTGRTAGSAGWTLGTQ